MGSFYFNVRDGETLTRDPDPYQFSTVEIARDSAIRMVRELFRARDEDELLNERRIEITDETGHPVSFVEVDDVQSNRGGMHPGENILAGPPELKL